MKNSASPRAARCLFPSRAVFVNHHGRNDFPRWKGLFCFNTAHLATQRRPILLSIVTNAIVGSDNVMALPNTWQFTSYAHVYRSC